MTQTEPSFDLETIRTISERAAFNRWAGFDVARAADGESELRFLWKEEFGQYAGFLHAGLIAAALDTACGFAAASTCGHVTASHFSMSCLLPAKGDTFTAVGRIIRAGRRQVFTKADLFAQTKGSEPAMVASGEAILLKIPA